MDKILMSGASGFIGSYIYESIKSEFDVTTIGRKKSSNIYLDLESLNDEPVLEDSFKTDVYIHCAGVIDEEFKYNEDKPWNKVLIGIPKLLNMLVSKNVKKLIYISTMHVYGKTDKHINEATCADPISDYAIAHFVTEQIFKRTGVETVILRPSTVYGLSRNFNNFKRESLIQYDFPKQIITNNSIKLNTSGEQKLNFVDIDVLAQAVKIELKRKKKCINKVVNIAGGIEISVKDYAYIVKNTYESIVGEKSEIIINDSKRVGNDKFHYETSCPIKTDLSIEDDVSFVLKTLIAKGGKLV